MFFKFVSKKKIQNFFSKIFSPNFFDFVVKKSFLTKIFFNVAEINLKSGVHFILVLSCSNCYNKFDFVGSIVYLSCFNSQQDLIQSNFITHTRLHIDHISDYGSTSTGSLLITLNRVSAAFAIFETYF